MKKIILMLSALTLFALPLLAIDTGSALQENDALAPTIIVIPPPAEMEDIIDPDEYMVGVGDQFLIELPIEQTTMVVPVLPTGELSIAGKMTINVKGMSLSDVYKKIAEDQGEYMKISLYDVKNILVPVVGAVRSPSIYKMKATSRISDIVRKVPLRYIGKEYEIHIRSDKDTTVVNVFDFFLNGDKSQNPYIRAGQTIYVPFADAETECVEVYGPVMVRSLVPFIPGETLGDFYRRKVILSDVVNYDKIVLIRDGMQNILTSREMDSFVLQPNDRIEFMTLKKIMVSGHVNRPGTYEFVPGHTVTDYIAMAGGANYKGSDKSAIVIRDGKKHKNPQDLKIERGDIILVKRSAEDILIGEISILSFVSMIATVASTVITAMIAAGNL